jgi:hypothetical protein
MPERYEKEIEEILRRKGSELGTPQRPEKPRAGFWRLVGQNLKKSLGGHAFSISPGRVLLIALTLVLAWAVLRGVGVGGMFALLGWVGLLLFIIGYGMIFVQPRGVEKRWRGQPLDTPSSGSLLDRIRGRFKKK